MEERKLFTKRFIKDLFYIALFGVAFYILTHNPITRPEPKVPLGVWSIQLMQHPLIFGIAGHNFLTLRNEQGAIVKELHGLATDAQTNTWKYVGTKTTDRLKVWEFNGSRDYIAQKDYPGVVIFEGDKDTVLSTWNRSYNCKETINAMDLSYPPYGMRIQGDTENSNSVAYTLSLCMGLSTERLGLLTPGWGKNLLGTAVGR